MVAERQLAFAKPEQANRIKRASRKAAQQFLIITNRFAKILRIPGAFGMIELREFAECAYRKCRPDFGKGIHRGRVFAELKMTRAEVIERAVAVGVGGETVNDGLKHLLRLAIGVLLKIELP